MTEQAAATAPDEHTEHEDDGWQIEIPDHPGRTDSPEFQHSKEAAHKILHEVVTAGDELLSFLSGEGK